MSRNRRSRQQGEGHASLGNFMLHWGAKLVFLTLIVVVVLSLTQCTVKKPEAPEWNTQLTVPLVNRTYAMPEIISRIDQDAISMDADSNVVFSVEKALDTVQLDAANLSTASITYSDSMAIGEFEFVAPTVPTMSVAYTDIPGLPSVFPATLPPAWIYLPEFDAFSNCSEFAEAHVTSGHMYVVLSNNLGIDLDTVKVYLSLSFAPQLFLPGFPNGLQSGETDSVFVDLAGEDMNCTMFATVMCYTPGGSVPDPTNKSLDVEIHFSNTLTADIVEAKVAPLSRQFESMVTLQESDVISSAQISSGDVVLTLQNNTPLPAVIEVAIPDLKLSSVPLVISTPVAPFDQSEVTISLAGYQLQPADLSLPQSLPIQIQASSIGSGNSAVNLQSQMDFAVQGSLQNLHFSSVTGNFNSTNMTIDPILQEIDVPMGFDSIQLVNAVLTIELENSVGLPGQLDIHLNGNNGKTLDITGTVNARVLATAATTTFTETDVANFLSPLPSQVSISGSASFGDGTSGTIRDGDYITGTVRIDAPVEMIIPQTPIETDIESEEIEQDDIDQITDHVIEARLVYNITNHLPIGASVVLMLSPDSATLYSNPELTIDSISVGAAPVVSSVVVDTLSTGEMSIILDSADIQILKHEKLYIGQELILHGSNGQPVKLTKNDFILVLARIEVEYRFDGEF